MGLIAIYSKDSNAQPTDIQRKPSIQFQAKIFNIPYSNLSAAFKQNSKDGTSLSLPQYNQCIWSLLQFNLPFVGYTYLSEKLFYLLDKNRTGMIDYPTFETGIAYVLSGNDARMRFTFEAMRLDPEKESIDYIEIFDFFFKSWLYASRLVFYCLQQSKSEFLRAGIAFPSDVRELENYACNHKGELNGYLVKCLSETGNSSSQPISYEGFQRFLIKDHTLEMTYLNKVFKFAMSLQCLESVGITG